MRPRILFVLLLLVVSTAVAGWFASRRRAHESNAARATTPDPATPSPLPPPALATREALPAPSSNPAGPLPPAAPSPADVETQDEASDGKETDAVAFGRVISSLDHRPLRDAVVGVPKSLDFSVDDGEGSDRTGAWSLRDFVPSSTAETDSDGRFELSIAEPSARHEVGKGGGRTLFAGRGSVLLVRAAGHGSVIIDRDSLGKDRDHPLEIRLDASGVLRGRLLVGAGESTEPWTVRLVAHAYEAIQPRETLIESVLLQSVGVEQSLDAQGEVTIDSLPAEVPFNVELSLQNGRNLRDGEALVLEAGKTTIREWHLGSGARIRGRIVDQDGAPVAAQELWLSQRGLFLDRDAERATFYTSDREKIAGSTRSGTDGSFEFLDVAAGKWWLGVAAQYHHWDISDVDERALPPIALRLEVRAGANLDDVSLVVHRGLYIRGRMVDPQGVAASGFIRAWAGSSRLVAMEDSETKADGTFVLGPLEPGDYELTGEPCAFSDKGVTLAPSKPMIVAAGRSDVTIELTRGGTIRPEAVRADTGAKVEAAFCLVASNDPEVLHGSGQYSPNTVAYFAGLPPGSYELAAVTPDGFAGGRSAIMLAAGQVLEDVRVTVEPGAKLVLRYVGKTPEYAQVSVWQGPIYFGGDGIHAGSSTTCVAPRGKITVKWTAGGDHFDEELGLDVGETRELSWPREK
jgi:hypothetical protein